MYDGILRIEKPDVVNLVGYADEIAIVVHQVARNCNATIVAAKSWLQYNTVQSSPQLTYLGVTLDSRLSFKTHLKQSGEKGARTCNTLSRLMPDIGGPNDTARVLLASVSKSVMLYATPVWAHATTRKSYSRVTKSAHRLSNLRICRAYHTVSDEAAGVLAGRMPIDLEALLATDSIFLCSRLRMTETEQSLSDSYLEIRDKYLNEWQHR
ncbi:uncharacterized protein LOC119675261 [Teleopsis dalmanni]|uniref:uncharacterized protein LOC119675261 n=1 Tax=Teleopsis dalmanni TaxID=139649 RepID=UPI0018CF8111|nr:uncharacterized protein LOC119675261 [Teleopsis dalmanni]